MQRKIAVGFLTVVSLSVLCGGAYYVWLTTPPSMPVTMDEATNLLTSARYKRLPEDRKMVYLARIRDMVSTLDDEQQRKLRQTIKDDPELRSASREVMWQMIIDRARQFAMTDKAQRDQLLDQFIDMMESRRQSRPNLTPQEEAQREERRAERMDQMTKRMDEQTSKGNPQHQAYIGEFFKAMSKRRVERGLPQMR